MKIIENNGLRLLLPQSNDFMLYNVNSNSYHEKIYLGKFDNIDNYREIEKSLINNKSKDMDDLLDIINKQDIALTDLANKLAELAKLVPSNDDKIQ